MSMYKLMEYSSNYSETTGCLWFYSKDEGTNFNADIANTDNSKSFKSKAKLLGNTVAEPGANAANGILKNATIAVPLKYLSNFWIFLEIPFFNCNLELKLRWTKYCVLSVASTDNVNGNNDDNNIIFTIKDTKLYVPVVTLSARDNKKLSELLSKGFERSVYWNEYKAKSDNKNATNEFRYFLELNFVGVNRLFALVYSNEDAASNKRLKAKKYYLPKGVNRLFALLYSNEDADSNKRFKAKKYYSPKGIINNCNVIINGKNFYDQVNDSDIKRYKIWTR